jgi:two-component system sensor histidine kinase/response regulator
LAVRGTADAARRAGIAAYLTKPVRQSQLYDALATVIDAGPDAAPLVTRHTISESRARQRPRLLVVEDYPVNQKVAVGMLAKLGYRADVAANGLEALEAVARFDYGAVLMDCQMPEMDGYTATTEIRAREGDRTHIPIIAMTAAAGEGEREKCLSAGMDDYVSKPVSLDDLDCALRRWLSPGEEATFDPETVAALRSLGAEDEPDAFVELTTLFVPSGAGLLETLGGALARGDDEAVGQVAHTLKGGAANLGALRLADACGALEDACGTPEAAPAAALVEAEFEQVRAWVDAELPQA